jgi:hypothetical protein
MGEGERSLATVRNGLLLIYSGLILGILDLMASFVLGLLAAVRGIDLTAVLVAAMIVGLVASLMDLAGRFLCLSAPEKSQAQGAIYASVGCGVANLALAPGGYFLEMPILTAIGNLAQGCGYFLFVIFLKRLAEYIGNPQLAAKARTILIATVVVAVAYALMIAASRYKPVHALCVLALWIAALSLFIMYANLILYLRNATRGYHAPEGVK